MGTTNATLPTISRLRTLTHVLPTSIVLAFLFLLCLTHITTGNIYTRGFPTLVDREDAPPHNFLTEQLISTSPIGANVPRDEDMPYELYYDTSTPTELNTSEMTTQQDSVGDASRYQNYASDGSLGSDIFEDDELYAKITRFDHIYEALGAQGGTTTAATTTTTKHLPSSVWDSFFSPPSTPQQQQHDVVFDLGDYTPEEAEGLVPTQNPWLLEQHARQQQKNAQRKNQHQHHQQQLPHPNHPDQSHASTALTTSTFYLMAEGDPASHIVSLPLCPAHQALAQCVPYTGKYCAAFFNPNPATPPQLVGIPMGQTLEQMEARIRIHAHRILSADQYFHCDLRLLANICMRIYQPCDVLEPEDPTEPPAFVRLPYCRTTCPRTECPSQTGLAVPTTCCEGTSPINIPLPQNYNCSNIFDNFLSNIASQNADTILAPLELKCPYPMYTASRVESDQTYLSGYCSAPCPSAFIDPSIYKSQDVTIAILNVVSLLCCAYLLITWYKFRKFCFPTYYGVMYTICIAIITITLTVLIIMSWGQQQNLANSLCRNHYTEFHMSDGYNTTSWVVVQGAICIFLLTASCIWSLFSILETLATVWFLDRSKFYRLTAPYKPFIYHGLAWGVSLYTMVGPLAFSQVGATSIGGAFGWIGPSRRMYQMLQTRLRRESTGSFDSDAKVQVYDVGSTFFYIPLWIILSLTFLFALLTIIWLVLYKWDCSAAIPGASSLHSSRRDSPQQQQAQLEHPNHPPNSRKSNGATPSVQPPHGAENYPHNTPPNPRTDHPNKSQSHANSPRPSQSQSEQPQQPPAPTPLSMVNIEIWLVIRMVLFALSSVFIAIVFVVYKIYIVDQRDIIDVDDNSYFACLTGLVAALDDFEAYRLCTRKSNLNYAPVFLLSATINSLGVIAWLVHGTQIRLFYGWVGFANKYWWQREDGFLAKCTMQYEIMEAKLRAERAKREDERVEKAERKKREEKYRRKLEKRKALLAAAAAAAEQQQQQQQQNPTPSTPDKLSKTNQKQIELGEMHGKEQERGEHNELDQNHVLQCDPDPIMYMESLDPHDTPLSPRQLIPGFEHHRNRTNSHYTNNNNNNNNNDNRASYHTHKSNTNNHSNPSPLQDRLAPLPTVPNNLSGGSFPIYGHSPPPPLSVGSPGLRRNPSCDGNPQLSVGTPLGSHHHAFHALHNPDASLHSNITPMGLGFGCDPLPTLLNNNSGGSAPIQTQTWMQHREQQQQQQQRERGVEPPTGPDGFVPVLKNNNSGGHYSRGESHGSYLQQQQQAQLLKLQREQQEQQRQLHLQQQQQLFELQMEQQRQLREEQLRLQRLQEAEEARIAQEEVLKKQQEKEARREHRRVTREMRAAAKAERKKQREEEKRLAAAARAAEKPTQSSLKKTSKIGSKMGSKLSSKVHSKSVRISEIPDVQPIESRKQSKISKQSKASKKSQKHNHTTASRASKQYQTSKHNKPLPAISGSSVSSILSSSYSSFSSEDDDDDDDDEVDSVKRQRRHKGGKKNTDSRHQQQTSTNSKMVGINPSRIIISKTSILEEDEESIVLQAPEEEHSNIIPKLPLKYVGDHHREHRPIDRVSSQRAPKTPTPAVQSQMDILNAIGLESSMSSLGEISTDSSFEETPPRFFGRRR